MGTQVLSQRYHYTCLGIGINSVVVLRHRCCDNLLRTLELYSPSLLTLARFTPLQNKNIALYSPVMGKCHCVVSWMKSYQLIK